MLFFIFCCFFLFLAAPTSAVDVREMSIDEYINFVNPPPVHKYQTEFGDSMLCVKFSDQISVKYAQDNITRGLEKPPDFELKSSLLNISNFDSGAVNYSKLGVKSECPGNTVAIREIKREDVQRAGSVRQFLNMGGRNKRITTNDDVDDVAGNRREYAIVSFQSNADPINGVSAAFNIWSPHIGLRGVFSASQIWIGNNTGVEESIEVGWMVFPAKYQDRRPRFFVYWTPDGYVSGCYNEDCAGFVSIRGGPISPGSVLQPVSVIEGEQYEFEVAVLQQVREDIGLAWVLYYDKVVIGYWPASLFRHLSQSAKKFDVGGQVSYLRQRAGRRLTNTHMGSGRFPWRGFGYAAYTRNIKMYSYQGNAISEIHRDPDPFVSDPACYNMRYTHSDTVDLGNILFFGGPGGDNIDCVG